jgi:hypothetical protein
LKESINGGSELKRVVAVFKPIENQAKESSYNPATGPASPTEYPMEIYLEKKDDNDYIMHVLLGLEKDEKNMHIRGDNLQACMLKLADYQKELPDGTIYYYNRRFFPHFKVGVSPSIMIGQNSFAENTK